MKSAILEPVFALAGWTGVMLLLVAFRRLRAGFGGQVHPHEYALGESAQVPAHIVLANRNYMNLLELPLLFYVACVLIHATGNGTPALQALAWAYVALRVTHSLIHVTYNHVLHRFVAFASSNVVLLLIWLGLGRAVLGAPAAP